MPCHLLFRFTVAACEARCAAGIQEDTQVSDMGMQALDMELEDMEEAMQALDMELEDMEEAMQA